MTEKQVKQLLKLLDQFREISTPDDKLNSRERGVLAAIRQWVVWYGRDTLEMDI
jgi:hypothetical protein